MKKTTLKTFKRFIKEEQEKYYTIDFMKNTPKEEVIFYMNQLLPLMMKMIKNTDITVTVEPILDGEEE
jgi:hypothetical protein